MAGEFHRYKVGDIEVTAVPDGFRMVPLDNYIMNASKEEINAALAAAGLPSDKVKNTYCPIVVTTAACSCSLNFASLAWSTIIPIAAVV